MWLCQNRSSFYVYSSMENLYLDTNTLLDAAWFLLLQIYWVQCFFEVLVTNSRWLMDWMRGYLAFLSRQGIKVSSIFDSTSLGETHIFVIYSLSPCVDLFWLIEIESESVLFLFTWRQRLISSFPVLSGILPCGDIAALVYLWNPFTIVCCVGLSTSPIENLAVILALNGAVTRKKIMILAYWYCQ